MQSSQKIYDLQSFSALDLSSKKIGILGGSFNPPHKGHLAISLRALEAEVDYVVWLVTPQNPLKAAYKLTFEERLELCAKLTENNDKILVTDLEREINSYNSYDTIKYLISHFPNIEFVWLMGVDCLKEFHLWENYDKIPSLVKMIIFNRLGYTEFLRESIAGNKLHKLYGDRIKFIPEMLSDLSSSEIRSRDIK